MGDPFWNNTVLLTGFEDGADGTTTVADESQYAHGAAAAVGAAQIDTAQAKSGASSGLFGAGDKFNWADSADWHFGSSTKFTLEIFTRFNALVDPAFLLSQWVTGGDLEWVLLWNAGNLEWTVSEDGSGFNTDISTPWSPSNGVWYHVALDYDLVKYRAYVDGVMLSSFTGGRNLFASSGGLDISSAIESRNIDGWADEVRITKGVARYATDTSFSVPSVPFPRIGNPPAIGGAALLTGL